ncbi:hypothetical protein HU200_031927 [Digitaria exilis]|uniref:C2H2-type domain-containing protein n=1 Tax=Digitaria exilis TaxID=1010633 RepID=A0A835ER10_9POAL|nr:hypothetical protein HU200_031927 [Digitaria exilis]
MSMETSVDDTASLLMLLSQQQQERRGATLGRVFVCKTCGRRFPTFQALGGHRASHRRPTRPYDAAPGLRRTTTTHGEGECAAAAGPRVHGCPVCGVEFAVGQALGGHMRRHRTAGALGSGDTTSVKLEDVGTDDDSDRGDGICLDLNLAPSENCAKCRMNTVVQGVQKTLIFDCPL